MGCVFGREISSSAPPSGGVVAGKGRGKGGDKDLSVPSGRREKVVLDPVSKYEEEGHDDEAQNGEDTKEDERKEGSRRRQKGERRRPRPNPRLSNPPNHIHGEQVAAGWPSWLSAVAGEVINGWTPRRADSFEKIDKIGQGTYSNVYKARDAISGKIVALKKVRFDNLEPESVRFMAREILILRRLDHPNVVKLQGLVTSRMSCSLYLVFDYMEHDLAGLASSPGIKFTEPQVKCYMHQLLSGLEHCHNRHVLHRDIKGSNLLIDDGGVLKIADFGLASTFDPNKRQPMTSRVVTLWYRPPELLLGATEYGVGVDLWSAGCILAELFAGKPIMTGRTEVEQLHRIFKLCGSPSEEYWKKSRLPHATIFKPQQSYKRCIKQTFKDFSQCSLPLIDTLLSIDPSERQTATAALKSEFFLTKPYACDPSSLPKYPPSKEIDAKRRDEESRRLRATGKAHADGGKKARVRERGMRPMAAPEANAELQTNIDVHHLIFNTSLSLSLDMHNFILTSACLINKFFLPFTLYFKRSKSPATELWFGDYLCASVLIYMNRFVTMSYLKMHLFKKMKVEDKYGEGTCKLCVCDNFFDPMKQRRRLITHANAKSKSEKFPPPHQDGGLGFPSGLSHHADPTFDPPDVPFSSVNFSYSKDLIQTWSGPLADPAGVGAPRRKLKPSKKDYRKDKNYIRNEEKGTM